MLTSQEDLYRSVVAKIGQTAGNSRVAQKLDWVSMHGPGTPKTGEVSPWLSDFDNAVQSILFADGPLNWEVRQVVGVEDLKRLSHIEQLLTAREDCSADYEVVAYRSTTPPVPSPLIIGNLWVYLSTQDERSHRAKHGFYLESPEAASVMTDYFNFVVRDADYRIRSHAGINDSEIRKLRRDLANEG